VHDEEQQPERQRQQRRERRAAQLTGALPSEQGAEQRRGEQVAIAHLGRSQGDPLELREPAARCGRAQHGVRMLQQLVGYEPCVCGGEEQEADLQPQVGRNSREERSEGDARGPDQHQCRSFADECLA
jgi:hypothetical protein